MNRVPLCLLLASATVLSAAQGHAQSTAASPGRPAVVRPAPPQPPDAAAKLKTVEQQREAYRRSKEQAAEMAAQGPNVQAGPGMRTRIFVSTNAVSRSSSSGSGSASAGAGSGAGARIGVGAPRFGAGGPGGGGGGGGAGGGGMPGGTVRSQRTDYFQGGPNGGSGGGSGSSSGSGVSNASGGGSGRPRPGQR